MDLQARKLEFIQEFIKIQSEEIVLQLEKILTLEKKKIDLEEMKPFSLEEFNQRIDKSMSDSKEGKLTEHKDLLAEIKQWH
jgi:hypothetical protein